MNVLRVRYRFHHDTSDPGIGPKITADDIADPLTGRYTNDADRGAVWPLVICIARRFQEYADSGSAAWVETLHMRDRPEWLVKAGQHEAEATFDDIGTFKVVPLDEGEEKISFASGVL